MPERAIAESEIEGVVDRLFREEHGRVVATLIRVLGDFDLAEEATQEAFTAALERWPKTGVPANPAAWITTTARNRAIDRVRRERNLERKKGDLALIQVVEGGGEECDMEASAISDDRLRLIFTCCHPALAPEAQIALTLRTLGGLRTPEIARAFLVSEATMAQRLVRAKKKIKVARIPYRVPPDHLLPERLQSVMGALYLIFNEGYSASLGDSLIRSELCGEAIGLARVLVELMPDEPEAVGLLALMLLQDSRRETRMDPAGDLVLLEEQDRSRWDARSIEEGTALVERALRRHRPGPYQIQAAIAAVHAEAKRAEDTDWRQIAVLYAHLSRLQPTPVLELNRAVAVAMAGDVQGGLDIAEPLSGELAEYYLFHATRADLLRRLDRPEEAGAAYGRALELATNDVERNFLMRRLGEVERASRTDD